MMQCPKCKRSIDLRIHAIVPTTAFIDAEGNVLESEPSAGIEWESVTDSSCGACEWNGQVYELYTEEAPQ